MHFQIDLAVLELHQIVHSRKLISTNVFLGSYFRNDIHTNMWVHFQKISHSVNTWIKPDKQIYQYMLLINECTCFFFSLESAAMKFELRWLKFLAIFCSAILEKLIYNYWHFLQGIYMGRYLRSIHSRHTIRFMFSFENYQFSAGKLLPETYTLIEDNWIWTYSNYSVKYFSLD